MPPVVVEQQSEVRDKEVEEESSHWSERAAAVAAVAEAFPYDQVKVEEEEFHQSRFHWKA